MGDLQDARYGSVLRQLIDLETVRGGGAVPPPQGRRPCTPVEKQKL